jgi:hypothetical protein
MDITLKLYADWLLFSRSGSQEPGIFFVFSFALARLVVTVKATAIPMVGTVFAPGTATALTCSWHNGR